MLRRRLLEALFKFKSNTNSISFAYGIKLPTETVKEYGKYVGNNQSFTQINGDVYYVLNGSNSIYEGTYDHNPITTYYVNIATYNFKTTSANQEVTFNFIVDSENPNDFLGASKLDSTDKQNLAVKISGSVSKDYTYTVTSPGDHFIKVYYYQHNDGIISGQNRGLFRMIPYDIIPYDWRYKEPNSQSITFTSYYGWNLNSETKPSWITLSKSTDVSGINEITISAQGNPGNARNCSIEFIEKYSGQKININVYQEANPHPNDILLSYSKLTIPQDYSSSTVIDVELIGNTSYNISNVSNGLSVTPVSGSSNQITVNTGIGNNSNGSFRITGNAGTVKDITITKENVSCYCDVNVGNSCLCHANIPFSKKDDTICPTNNCGSNSQISCPKHCTAYNGCKCYGYWACPNDGTITVNSCPSHTSCSCDCQSVDLCTCNTNIVCDCNNGDNGASTQPCTHGGASTQSCTHGGASTQPCTHGGASTQPCTHGGVSTKACTHGGASTQPCTHGGRDCTCYGNVGSKACSCYGNVGSKACDCYGNTGWTTCSCYGNVGSKACDCYGNTGSKACSCYGNVGSKACDCYGYSAGSSWQPCSCNNCNDDTDCYDSYCGSYGTVTCNTNCSCDTVCKCDVKYGCSCDQNHWTPDGCHDVCSCYNNHEKCGVKSGGCTCNALGTGCDDHCPKYHCGAYHRSGCGYTISEKGGDKPGTGWLYCSATCTCELWYSSTSCNCYGYDPGSSTQPCTHGGASTQPCTHGGASTQSCTHGGASTQPCTHGGASTQSCTHGGASTQPCTHGGASTQSCTHGGASTQSCTYGGTTCSCYGNVGSTTCSCYGNVGSTACSCYGNVGSTACSCYGNVGSKPCDCYGNTGWTTCSCYGNVSSKPCDCYGYHKVESCHSHDNNCLTKDCNAYYPNSCDCNTKTYYPHCDCDQYCKCEGYVAPSVG